MTASELEWVTCRYAYDMLEFLGDRGDDRKLRLFACACCRASWDLLTDPRSRAAVEAGERYADGEIPFEELAAAAGAAPQGGTHGGSWVGWNKVHLPPRAQAERSVIAAAGEGASDAAWETVRESLTLLRQLQCDLLRDIFGNPFRPAAVDRSWLSWNQGTAVTIARGIEDDRAYDRMPFLGDALEAAGCDDAEILAHCRSESDHVRGCWVVDAVLGRS